MSFTSETKNRIEVPSLHKVAVQGMFAGLMIKFTMCLFLLVYCLSSCKFQILSSCSYQQHKPVCFVQILTLSVLTAMTPVWSMLTETLVVIAARRCIIVSTQLHGRLIQFINVSAGKEKFLLSKMTERCYRHPAHQRLISLLVENKTPLPNSFQF